MSIALLCPSMGRADKCARMVLSVYNTTSQNIQIYIAVPENEFSLYKQTLRLPESNRVGICLVVIPDQPTVHKWNSLAELAMTQEHNKFFMLAADDMIFSTPNWDEALAEKYNAKPHIYAFRDSRDAFGTPHPIATREYIEAMGWFLPPLFMHWFCDSWTVQIAKANNCFTHLLDYMLIHEKPSDKGLTDETHNRIRRNGWRERDKWVEEKSRDVLEIYKGKLA